VFVMVSQNELSRELIGELGDVVPRELQYESDTASRKYKGHGFFFSRESSKKTLNRVIDISWDASRQTPGAIGTENGYHRVEPATLRL